jgi:hypothetical protein
LNRRIIAQAPQNTTTKFHATASMHKRNLTVEVPDFAERKRQRDADRQDADRQDADSQDAKEGPADPHETYCLTERNWPDWQHHVFPHFRPTPTYQPTSPTYQPTSPSYSPTKPPVALEQVMKNSAKKIKQDSAEQLACAELTLVAMDKHIAALGAKIAATDQKIAATDQKIAALDQHAPNTPETPPGAA